MITIREATLNGLRGQEISFYTGEDAGENVYLALPKEMFPGTLSPKLQVETGPGLGMSLPMGLEGTLCAANNALKELYNAYAVMKDPPVNTECEDPAWFTVHVGSVASGVYQIKIQEVFYLLHKICFATVLLKADWIVPKGGEMPTSIPNLFGKKEISPYHKAIIEATFKRPESIELFRIIDGVNSAFQSIHMFTVINMMGEVTPSVCAFAPPDHSDYAFLLHNHSVWQVIKGLNTALQDLNLI